MSAQARIYVSGAFAFGEEQAVNNLIASGYSSVIIWSVHVHANGDLILNNTQIVSGGVYQEAQPMNLPARVAQLRKAGIEIIFSVGAWGNADFKNINTLMGGSVPGPGNILYDNFAALKQAMVSAGGDIDAIDFDNEDYAVASTMVDFADMLGNIGYKSVTLCPYTVDEVWTDTYHQLMANGKNFVSAIHYQCYSGGQYNSPSDWAGILTGNTLLIAGLATNQAAPGPWWDGSTQAPGQSVVTVPGMAMYGGGDWSNMLRQGNYATVEAAMQSTLGPETFFFYCNGPMNLGPGKQFNTGDAVFFGDQPQWATAPQCNGYSLSGGCSNIYNLNGACPADIQTQFQNWNNGTYTLNGGFIWLYDSIVNCLLSNCCNETDATTAQVATSYKNAIITGLGG